MSKRQPKSQASSARAAATAYSFGISGFRSARAQLSYLTTQPDLSSISDPNAVVYFRNLSKKDSTTKAKALEDLQAFVSALQQPVEDAVLEAWVGAPRKPHGTACTDPVLFADPRLPAHLD